MLRARSKFLIAMTKVQYRASVQVPRPLAVLGTRFNSSLTPEQRKAYNKAKEELQKDWATPILTYETVKQKSQQPSEVCFIFTVIQSSPKFRSRMSI